MKLSGIRVLDLSQFLPGPHLTMVMADHGADVIAIEPANGIGEPTRAIGEDLGSSTVYHRNVSRGKRSLKLNLKSEGGSALFLKLAARADVIVESFRPGVVARLGVDYETVKAHNPAIIYCSLSAFGQSESSFRLRAAHDLSVQALAGTVDLGRGMKDNMPCVPNMPSADMTSSLMGLIGILMALYRRTQTGAGDYIDMSMYDAVLGWTPNVLGPVFADNRDPVPEDMRTLGGAALYRLYETKDGGVISLGGSEPQFAERLLTALGRPDLIAAATTPPGPGQRPVKDFLQETFLIRTKAEWEAFLSQLDICWGPVRTLREAFADPFTVAREMLLKDDAGDPHVGVPIKFADEPAAPNLAVAGYGEHSRDIAREAGLSNDEIDSLIAEGTI